MGDRAILVMLSLLWLILRVDRMAAINAYRKLHG